MTIETYLSLSPYARFWFRYMGYNLRDKTTGITYTKGRFWDKHNHLAFMSTKYDPKTKPKPPKGFVLIKRTDLQFNINTVLYS